MITNDNIKKSPLFNFLVTPRYYGINYKKLKWRHLLHYPKNDNILATNLAKYRSRIKV